MKRAAPGRNASIVFGRRLRGRAKGMRSGPVGRKRRRRSWTAEHGVEWLKANHVTETRAPQRRLRFTQGRTYGPFGGERSAS